MLGKSEMQRKTIIIIIIIIMKARKNMYIKCIIVFNTTKTKKKRKLPQTFVKWAFIPLKWSMFYDFFFAHCMLNNNSVCLMLIANKYDGSLSNKVNTV